MLKLKLVSMLVALPAALLASDSPITIGGGSPLHLEHAQAWRRISANEIRPQDSDRTVTGVDVTIGKNATQTFQFSGQKLEIVLATDATNLSVASNDKGQELVLTTDQSSFDDDFDHSSSGVYHGRRNIRVTSLIIKQAGVLQKIPNAQGRHVVIVIHYEK